MVWTTQFEATWNNKIRVKEQVISMGCGRMSCYDVGRSGARVALRKGAKFVVRNEGVLGIAMNEHGSIFWLLITNTNITYY